MKETNKQRKKLRTLFLTFFKIGLFTFGGGYAMIPLIEHETVSRNHWIGSDELLDVFAIAQATPGVIAVNTATFVGYKVAGFFGALLATLGVILPSFIIISIISLFFVQFQKIAWVAYAFSGIRVGVIVLILGAVVNLGKRNQYTPLTGLVLVLAFCVAAFTKINIIFLIIGGALIGIIYQVILKKGLVSDQKSEDKS
ncbi:MAG: chromate transporter [Acetobacterium sp.]